MQCPNCKKEWSDTVHPHHVRRCDPEKTAVQNLVDAVVGEDLSQEDTAGLEPVYLDEMDIKELREFAKSKAITIPFTTRSTEAILEFIKAELAKEEAPAE